jgi:S-formylglutathione hydrolase FrmB
MTPQQLMQQLDPNSSHIVDAIRLAMSGNLFWEGMLANQLPVKMKREDAWETNPNDPTQMIKGTRISVEIHLSNLGTTTIVGTQFNDQLSISIQNAQTDSQSMFQSQLSQLQEQLQQQDIAVPQIQLKTE